MAAEDSPAGPAKVTVATTMRPDDPIEVTEREAAILRHQGLLAEDGPATQPADVKTAKAKPEGGTK